MKPQKNTQKESLRQNAQASARLHEYNEASKSARKEYKQEKRRARRLYLAKRRTLKSRFARTDAGLMAAYGVKGKPEPPKRTLAEELMNSISHGIGSVFAIVSFILLLILSDTPNEYAGAVIYSLGLFILFTASTLYHAFKHGGAAKRLFRRFDYSSIYILIGATFAPPLLNVVGGTFGAAFFIIQWAIIVAGITLVCVFGPARLRFIHIPAYVLLGWSALMLMPSLISSSFPLAMWILAGGVIYTLGIIPYVMKTKNAHSIWHVFVLLGALTQWIGIFKYIYLA